MKKTHDNKAIRAYIRENRHYTDDMIADTFGVSTRVVSANKAHITMGTDTDNPQKRAESKFSKSYKQLILIKTSTYNLIIDENGGFMRLDLKTRKMSRLTDEQAKSIMVNRLHETYN
jgi:hypothetical protein